MRFRAYALAFLALAACNGSGNTAKPPAVDDGVAVTRHVVDSEAPPANPATGDKTPAELNKAVFLRYASKTPPAEVKAILVLAPGFLGSANDFDYLGRRMVQRSAGAIEVWALDRRSNLMEDHTGFDAAEAAGDPDIAAEYYFPRNGEPLAIDGKTFAGFRDEAELAFMSEWGLDMHLRDVLTVVNQVPEPLRKKIVFVGGHSLGGYMTERFAAWDFDGDVSTTTDAGYNQVAGLVLLDGGGESGENISADEWRDGYDMFGFPLPGVAGLRSGEGDRTIALGPLDRSLLVVFELVGMYAHYLPKAASTIWNITPSFNLAAGLLFGKQQFNASNEAVFGFAVDNDTEPVSIVQVSAGLPAGGAVERVDLDLGVFGSSGSFLRPTDDAAFYTWEGFEAAGETTELDRFARMMFAGPSDFVEWYFPARLPIDFQAVADLAVPVSTGTFADEARLRFAHVRRVDAPIFAVAAGKGVAPEISSYDDLKALVAPVRGKTAPRSGDDYKVVRAPTYTHIDVLAADDERAPNAYFSELSAWLLTQSRGSIAPTELP